MSWEGHLQKHGTWNPQELCSRRVSNTFKSHTCWFDRPLLWKNCRCMTCTYKVCFLSIITKAIHWLQAYEATSTPKRILLWLDSLPITNLTNNDPWDDASCMQQACNLPSSAIQTLRRWDLSSAAPSALCGREHTETWTSKRWQGYRYYGQLGKISRTQF